MDKQAELGWEKNESKYFIDYGDVFTPERELQFEILISLMPNLQSGGDVLDLCCGEGKLGGEILSKYPLSKVHFYDGSSTMLDKVLSKGFDSTRIRTKLFDIEKGDWNTENIKFKVVTSSLAIHHLDGKGKQDLFRLVYSSLERDGVFAFVDIVSHQNKDVEKVSADLWDRAVEKQSLEKFGTPIAFEEFQRLEWNMYTDPNPDPIDNPSSIFDQLNWLNGAGFQEVDISWMQAGHAIFYAKKY